jgi:hypothetical protein
MVRTRCPEMPLLPRSRPVRRIKLAALLLVLGLTVLASFGASGNSRLTELATPPADYSDVKLYREIATRVADGESYHSAATRLQRAHNYPVKPFYTVRQPLVAWAGALFGDLRLPGCILLAIASLVWLMNLDKRSIFERTAALLFMLAAGLPLVLSPMRESHDVWGGLFITIALGLVIGRLSVVAAAFAVLVRELNFPLLGLFAIDKHSRSPALIAIALCLIALLLHRQAVLAWTLPADPQSQGWLGLRGPIGWVDDLSENTLLQLLPRPAAALLAFAPLLGWIELGRWRALAWFAGVAVLVTVLSRPDNSYWILNALPVWFIGLAFVPGFLISLSKRGVRVAAQQPDRAISGLSTP